MSLPIKYGMMKKARGGMMCAHGSSNCEMCHGGEYAEGGEVGAEEDNRRMDDWEDSEQDVAIDMVGRIIKQIMEEKEGKDDEGDMHNYSEGGEVANETEDEKVDLEPNEFDELVKDDDLDFNYDGENSGDYLGDEQEDEDRRDIVKRIMRQRMLHDRPSSGSNERVS